MRLSTIGSTVEGEKMELQCRKFSSHPPRRDSKLKKLVYPFKLSIHGFARITETYQDGKELCRETSHTALGDEVHGEAIDGFSLKPHGKERVEHATGTHKATFVSLRGGAYAHVEIGVREQLAQKKVIEQEVLEPLEYKPAG